MNEEFIHNVENLQNKLEDADLKLMVVVARNLWFRRNFVIYEGVFNHLSQLV